MTFRDLKVGDRFTLLSGKGKLGSDITVLFAKIKPLIDPDNCGVYNAMIVAKSEPSKIFEDHPVQQIIC